MLRQEELVEERENEAENKSKECEKEVKRLQALLAEKNENEPSVYLYPMLSSNSPAHSETIRNQRVLGRIASVDTLLTSLAGGGSDIVTFLQ